jgi:hypothetical protein
LNLYCIWIQSQNFICQKPQKGLDTLFVGFADNVGYALSFKILKNGSVKVSHRSMVRSVPNVSHWEKRMSFKSDVQESIKSLESKSSFVWKDSHHEYILRMKTNDVSNRTRSMTNWQ